MGNITLTAPDDTLRRARVLAAQRGTSVSGLFQAFIDTATGSTLNDDEVIDRLEHDMNARPIAVRQVTWSRAELHDRSA